MSDNMLPPLPFTLIKKDHGDITAENPIILQGIDPMTKKENEEVFHDHLQRVQETILDSVDSKIVNMKQRLKSAELKLKLSKEEQINSGVSLYKAQKNIVGLNKNLAKA
jgi:hypothetical protein